MRSLFRRAQKRIGPGTSKNLFSLFDALHLALAKRVSFTIDDGVLRCARRGLGRFLRLNRLSGATIGNIMAEVEICRDPDFPR